MQNDLFSEIRPWTGRIFQDIRKDLKSDYLPANREFTRKYFGSKPLSRLSAEEIFAACEKEIFEGADGEFAEWAVNRFIFKHGDVYRYFAEALSRINPHFQEIERLEDSQAEEIAQGAVTLFGAELTYLFAKLNAVVFPESLFERLRQAALEAPPAACEERKETVEEILRRHEQEKAKLQERYEAKLAGVQKKYQTDVDALKKQVRALQQRLSAHGR